MSTPALLSRFLSMKINLSLVLATTLVSFAVGFVSHSRVGWKLQYSRRLLAAVKDPLEELSEERKANLFQFLLRDLQVEQVPLLEVDSDQVHTLQAALWTTMAQISDQPDEQKACLIFEAIPIPALRSFVDDFTMLKTQDRLMQHLPELDRFSLSLVGKGVGPAILIEAANCTQVTPASAKIETNENRNTAAMKMFVDRMVAGREIASLSPDNNNGGSGMAYRVCNFSEACHVLSSFWNNVCEILATKDAPSIMLSIPGVKDLARFGAISELLSRSLCLYKGDALLELLHFHPAYDRQAFHPVDQPAHGHLPPMTYLRPMLKQYGAAVDVPDDDLAMLNYLRRAPVPSVCIVPVEQLDADDGVVSLELENGEVVDASGINAYSNGIIDLAKQGAEKLQSSWEAEIEIVR